MRQSRDAKHAAVISKGRSHQPLSLASVQHRQPDRRYYLRKIEQDARHFLTEAADELYYSIVTTLSIDELSRYHFKQYIWPVIASGAALVVGEIGKAGLNWVFPGHEELEVISTFLLGTAILSYSAMHRLTDSCPQTLKQLSTAVAAEVLAITYLYTSSFRGSQMWFHEMLSETTSLVTSLGLTILVIPEAFAYAAQKIQEKLIQREYAEGAQRLDTALMSSGLTPVSNIFFQGNHFVRSEITTLSRLFQLGLISDNILHADLSAGSYAAQLLHQFRNLPALITDTGPPVLKSFLMQQTKIAADYQHNTTKQKVVRFTEKGPEWIDIERCRLRSGDLVSCDVNFDFDAVPVSGEVVSFAFDENGKCTSKLLAKKISVNLKAHNGEDVWIELTTNILLPDKKKKVDLHAIHEGKQVGVLAGAKLNVNDSENCYICVQDQTERTLSSHDEKKAVINQIVSDRKQRQVVYSMVLALGMAALQAGDFDHFPSTVLRLLFNLTQMMIPFSETFLREMVNARLMKEINRNLVSIPMETIDALRVVDFFNALSGYYLNRFPQGVALVSDKTGTLTTAKMKVLGFWTAGMPVHVQGCLHDDSLLLPEDSEKKRACCEVFAEAFTHSKQELEPEECAILDLFRDQMDVDDYLKKIVTLGNHHFRKIIALEGCEKWVETYHLGLYRTFGGRFTLVDEGMKQYLVFCGVPKIDVFKDMPLLHTYAAMNVRTGVLSRDWCVARAPLSDEQFMAFKVLFSQNKLTEIDHLLAASPDLLGTLTHVGTFLIDNPVKKGVEQFISNCRQVNVPVLIATGDTAKSAENIARVLASDHINHLIRVSQSDLASLKNKHFPEQATVIFSGINPDILELFQQILKIDIQHRPVVIFSEMSTENKGVLTHYLKKHGFFVAVNGDGTNDVAMMREAHVVFAHVTDAGIYAPGVEQFANLSDRHLRRLLDSQGSFYELFDIHDPDSAFMRLFTPLANSQEKPIVALSLKSIKMGSELAKAVGVNARNILGLHWFGVIFDLLWLLCSLITINATTDLPMDNQSLDESNFPNYCMVFALAVAVFQSFAAYEISGESTNLTWMLLILAMLPILLRSIFAGFGSVQEELSSSAHMKDSVDEDEEVVTDNHQPTERPHGFAAFVSSFFQRSKKPLAQRDERTQTEKLEFNGGNKA